MSKKYKYSKGELVTLWYSDVELYEVKDMWHMGDVDETFYIIESLDDGLTLEVCEGELKSAYSKFANLWSTPDDGMDEEERAETADWNASFYVLTPGNKYDVVTIATDVDGLLDQYNMYTDLVNMFPDEDEFADTLEVIKSRLKIQAEVN